MQLEHNLLKQGERGRGGEQEEDGEGVEEGGSGKCCTTGVRHFDTYFRICRVDHSTSVPFSSLSLHGFQVRSCCSPGLWFYFGFVSLSSFICISKLANKMCYL